MQRSLTVLIGLLLCGWLYCAAAGLLLAEETSDLEVAVYPLYYKSRSSTITVLVEVSKAEAEQEFDGLIEVYHFDNGEQEETPIGAATFSMTIDPEEDEAEKKLSLELEEPLQGQHEIYVEITESTASPE